MTSEVPERPKPPASRRNTVKKVMFVSTTAVFNLVKEAVVVTQRSIFLRASAREL